MFDVAIARALHVLAVVIWIGGVAMVTMILLPAVRRGDTGPNQLQVFEAIERRFAWHARSAVVIVGLTGFYMTDKLDLWGRFRSGEFWWMQGCGCCLRSSSSRPSRSFCTDGSTRRRVRLRIALSPCCSGLTGCCSRSA
jgi:hypothetical protein